MTSVGLSGGGAAVRRVLAAVLVTVLAAAAGAAVAAEANPFEGLKLSAEAYIDWTRSDVQGVTSNAFTLNRGYVTVNKTLNDFLSFRYTLDVKSAKTTAEFPDTIDASVSNDLDGNYVFRTKYLYAEMNFGGEGAVSDLRARVGMQHAGLDDFEQSMNPYRAQARNWQEGAGWFGTADLGVGLHGNFGGRLDDAKGRTGSSKYDGRHGSFQLLLANGGGYDKAEKNENKLLSGRVSVRPAAAALPGLQLTYAGVFGQDNTTNGGDGAGVDFSLHAFMVSWQSPRFTAYGQYFLAENNQAGKYVSGGEGVKTGGLSAVAIARPRVAKDRLGVYARYNVFDGDRDEVITEGDHQVTQVTGGVSYDVAKGNMFIVAYEVTSYDEFARALGSLPSASAQNRDDDKKLQLVYRLEF